MELKMYKLITDIHDQKTLKTTTSWTFGYLKNVPKEGVEEKDPKLSHGPNVSRKKGPTMYKCINKYEKYKEQID